MEIYEFNVRVTEDGRVLKRRRKSVKFGTRNWNKVSNKARLNSGCMEELEKEFHDGYQEEIERV